MRQLRRLKGHWQSLVMVTNIMNFCKCSEVVIWCWLSGYHQGWCCDTWSAPVQCSAVLSEVFWLGWNYYELLTLTGSAAGDLNNHWFISSQIAATDSSWEKGKYSHCLDSCELYFAEASFSCQPARLSYHIIIM